MMHTTSTGIGITLTLLLLLAGCTKTVAPKPDEAPAAAETEDAAGDDLLRAVAALDAEDMDGVTPVESAASASSEAPTVVPPGEVRPAGEAAPAAGAAAAPAGQPASAPRGFWKAALAGRDPTQRVRALLALTAEWDPAALPAVTAALFDADAETRVAAGRALSAHRSPEVALAVMNAMDEHKGEPPIEPYQVLAAVGREANVLTLDFLVQRAILPDRSSAERQAATQAMAALGEPGAVPILVELARSGDPGIAAVASEGLARLTFHSDVASWGDWWAANGDRERVDWARERVSIENLAQLGAGRTGARIVAGGEPAPGESAALKRDLLSALEFLGDPAGGEALLGAFQAGSLPSVRLAAVALVPEALERGAGYKPLAALLVAAERDEERAVRLAAFTVVTRSPMMEAIPECIEALSDEDYDVRYQAITALRAFSGETYSYDPAAPPESAKRKFAQDVWRAWWETYEQNHGRRR